MEVFLFRPHSHFLFIGISEKRGEADTKKEPNYMNCRTLLTYGSCLLLSPLAGTLGGTAAANRVPTRRLLAKHKQQLILDD